MTSASTLTRRAIDAEKKGHKTAAKRLRTEAAKLRRSLRKKIKESAKKAKKTKKKEIIMGLSWDVLLEDQRTEAGKSEYDIAIDRALKHLKLSNDERIRLRAELVMAKADGRREGVEKAATEVKNMKEAHRISVVAGFMSIIELAQRANRGSLPPTMSLSGYTAAKVYDALRLAGYTTAGLNGSGIGRDEIRRAVVPSDPYRGE